MRVQATTPDRLGLQCPLGVLIADVGRYSPAAQAVAAQLVRRWQECLRNGVRATQSAGEADPALDPDRTAAAVIGAIQGGVVVLLSTGSAEHLEAGLDFCLERLFTLEHTARHPASRSDAAEVTT